MKSTAEIGLFSTPKTPRMVVEVSLGGCHRSVPLFNTPDKTAQFAYLNLNEYPAFVNEGARLIAKYLKEAGYNQAYFVTAEASTIALAHVLRSEYGIDGMILYKKPKLDDQNSISVNYSAITSESEQTLFLGRNKAENLLSAKQVIILDSICTKGSTIRAMHELLIKAGVSPDNIKEAVVLFMEGEPKKELDVGQADPLKLHFFSTLPLIKTAVPAPAPSF